MRRGCTMRRRQGIGIVLALVLGFASPSLAAADEELEVFLQMETYGEAVFGVVDLEAEVYPPSAEIERVLFFLDGKLEEVRNDPPYTAQLDVGDANQAHVFEVLVQAAGGNTATTSVATPPIKSDEEVAVKLQQLYVSVESEGRRRLDLKRDEFEVSDNGRRQRLETFESGDVPFTAVLMVDTSYSMRGDKLGLALRGVNSFVKNIGENDQTKLLLFSDRLLYEAPFTAVGSVLTLGLDTVAAEGGTALNDFLYVALKRLESRQGRRVIVLLSDGVDVESALSVEHVRWLANQIQPVIYWLRLDAHIPTTKERRSMWRLPKEHVEEMQQLERLVAESGGRVQPIEQMQDVEGAFQDILSELRDQYVIGYASTGEKGRHEVRVKLKRPGMTARARGSYLDSVEWKGRR